MSYPASIHQAFEQYPGGVSMIPPAPARLDLAYCNEDLAHQMRKLWEDHVDWTRNYIIEAVYNKNPGAIQAAANRLLKNQDDIGNALKPVFGNDAGNSVTKLLKEHINLAVLIVDAARQGQRQKAAIFIDRWRDNGRVIARALHQLNPRYWPMRVIEKCMMDHINLTVVEVNARVNKDWAADVRAFDNVKKQILHKADVLTQGISRLLADRKRGVA